MVIYTGLSSYSLILYSYYTSMVAKKIFCIFRFFGIVKRFDATVRKHLVSYSLKNVIQCSLVLGFLIEKNRFRFWFLIWFLLNKSVLVLWNFNKNQIGPSPSVHMWCRVAAISMSYRSHSFDISQTDLEQRGHAYCECSCISFKQFLWIVWPQRITAISFLESNKYCRKK